LDYILSCVAVNILPVYCLERKK